jgi:hypothetical protein
MVKCADCGYLCYKNHETRTFDHVDAEARKTGQFPTWAHANSVIRERHRPYCFCVAFDLTEEFDETVQKLEKGEGVASEIISRDIIYQERKTAARTI